LLVVTYFSAVNVVGTEVELSVACNVTIVS